jgi:hypothetical protein
MNKVLAGKAEENIPLGRLTHRWEDGIWMDRLAGGGWGGFSCLVIESGGGLLWMLWWTFGLWRHGDRNTRKLSHYSDWDTSWTTGVCSGQRQMYLLLPPRTDMLCAPFLRILLPRHEADFHLYPMLPMSLQGVVINPLEQNGNYMHHLL